MKLVGTSFILFTLLALATAPGTGEVHPVPVLVELFTSEGCSSCPPADNLLQKLDAQPLPGAQLIVLSEHVDYWNHIGWTDPYSSHEFSDRQSAYGRRFRLDSVYTPQMIVDGAEEFVGSHPDEANKALTKAVAAAKISVRLSDLSATKGMLRARVESDPLPPPLHNADVMVALALNHAESQVARGENAGHRLTHVAVVRSLTKIGKVESGKSFSQDITLKLPVGSDPPAVRVISFIQESGQGKVLGVTQTTISK